MAKQVKQFRYYQDPSNKSTAGSSAKTLPNYPDGLSAKSLTSGAAFKNYPSIIQLGIQALPGTKFYVNGGYNPVIIGSTGIYELDLNGLSEITNLYFSQASIQAIEDSSTSLIIDILYENGW